MKAKCPSPIDRAEWPEETWGPWRPLRPDGPMKNGRREWSNDAYWVTENRIKSGGAAFFDRPMVRLGIQRIDQRACNDWRDFQAIKNDVCGTEAEGLQLYPSESRLLDPSNYYLLWVIPKGRIPCGVFAPRNVCGPDAAIAPQRAWAVSP